jgi:hypothetical protein
MENPRTETARDNDDSALIDTAEAPAEAGRSGGNLATDVSTQAELDALGDPEGRTRVTKADDIEHGEEQRPDRARAG